ncbi:OmpA family protein [Halalkalibacter urbisdiaboli]|uniref:OmpA family protein n=1 Tax=Halalkalibacter urbisdiaboli TaxID=1960589 RepID=UPI0013FD1F49|nr:OmpA family protein [Halalkalibacter urbisdiaboli]
MNQKYKRLLDNRSDDNDFWPSFTDVLSTILLVVLLFLMAIIISREDVLAEKERKIDEQEEIINYFVGIHSDIIEDLEAEFSQTELKIEIDKETGAIKFQNDLLFETGKEQIRQVFKNDLAVFIPAYFSILYGKYSDHIAEVVVEGHTDDVGTFMNNLELSQRRAFSVVQYILSDEFGDFPHKELVKDNITANGRSKSQLKYLEDGKTVDRENSRRVEFKFRLKNAENIEEVIRELNTSTNQ